MLALFLSIVAVFYVVWGLALGSCCYVHCCEAGWHFHMKQWKGEGNIVGNDPKLAPEQRENMAAHKGKIGQPTQVK
jgi:hypothetical protein